MAEAAVVPLTATPKEGQLVEHEGRTYRTIREGLAYILVPPNTKISQDPRTNAKAVTDESAPQAQNVFYNPIQQFNRDLSVLAIKAFGQDLCERRRAKWEKGRDRLALKRERRKDKKRKRIEDDEMGETTKIQRLDGETSPVEAVDENGSVVQSEAVVDDDSCVNGKGVSTEDLVAAPEPKDGDGQLPQSTHQPPQSPPFRILDALSATGLRALRYAQEIPFATSITANDMDPKAVKSIEMHLQHNNLAKRIQPTTANALAHMYAIAHPPAASHGPAHLSGKYDVIDLDPYGTAAPFIDAALQALNDGGLLCVTCTDSGVFASCGYSEKTFSLYGGLPVKGNHCHEAGLRLIAHSVATAGAKYGIAIEPLLSLSIDFYARLFIRVRRSPADVKFLAGKTMVTYECDTGCGAWTTQLIGRNVQQTSQGSSVRFKHGMSQGPSADKLCQHCGSKTHMAGPMWAGPLHHPAFIEKILKDVRSADKNIYSTTARIEGMLDTALDELLDVDYVKESQAPNSTIPKLAPESLDRQPFFLLPSAAAKAVHCVAPPEAAVKGALRHAGYRATRSHCKAGSVKTNAPWSVIWTIYREWVKQKSPVKVDNIRRESPGWNLLRLGTVEDATDAAAHEHDNASDGTNGTLKVDKINVVFDEALGRDKTGKKLVRYQENPRENWGPMSRAK